MKYRSGLGIAIHPLASDKAMVIGGVNIPSEKGIHGHSDGDVLSHAVIDALLGAAGLGDIGKQFPSSDQTLEGIKSLVLLDRTVKLLKLHGWRVEFVDATIMLEIPYLAPYIDQMKLSLANALNILDTDINIKATTTDKLGLIGREEGIGALAIATLEKINETI